MLSWCAGAPGTFCQLKLGFASLLSLQGTSAAEQHCWASHSALLPSGSESPEQRTLQVIFACSHLSPSPSKSSFLVALPVLS